MVLLLLSDVITMGFDSPENVERYADVVDSLKALTGWGVIVVGDGDSVFVGDSLLGTAPLLFKPDSFPVSIRTKRGKADRTFYIDTDTTTLVIVYASPYTGGEQELKGKKEEVHLPAHEEEGDGLVFNLHGKRVVIVKSVTKGWSMVRTFTDTLTLKYYWPHVDSLVRQVKGRGIVFIGAVDIKVDGVKYPGRTKLINNVPGGRHKVIAKGIAGRVRAYVDMDRADVVVFILAPSPKQFVSMKRMAVPEFGPGVYGCAGAMVGGAVGCCVASPTGSPQIGCVAGSILGGLIGILIGSSCM